MNQKIILAATLLGLSLGLTAPVEAGHFTRIYQVTMTPSIGLPFTDCMRFNVPAAGDLTIDLLFVPVIYRHGGLNTQLLKFKAVTTGDGFEIMFFGTFGQDLTGEAVSDGGATFTFTGVLNPACSVLAAAAAGPTASPWRQ